GTHGRQAVSQLGPVERVRQLRAFRGPRQCRTAAADPGWYRVEEGRGSARVRGPASDERQRSERSEESPHLAGGQDESVGRRDAARVRSPVTSQLRKPGTVPRAGWRSVRGGSPPGNGTEAAGLAGWSGCHRATYRSRSHGRQKYWSRTGHRRGRANTSG